MFTFVKVFDFTRAESVSPAEMNSLKQKVSIMEKELSSNALKLNTSENLKKTLEQKVAKYEKEMKDKENTQVSVLQSLSVILMAGPYTEGACWL